MMNVDSAGYIMMNAHVVAGAERIGIVVCRVRA
jgi:hypothetical protein